MSTVVMHNVVSVDGYIADENDEVGPLSPGLKLLPPNLLGVST